LDVDEGALVGDDDVGVERALLGRVERHVVAETDKAIKTMETDTDTERTYQMRVESWIMEWTPHPTKHIAPSCMSLMCHPETCQCVGQTRRHADTL